MALHTSFVVSYTNNLHICKKLLFFLSPLLHDLRQEIQTRFWCLQSQVSAQPIQRADTGLEAFFFKGILMRQLAPGTFLTVLWESAICIRSTGPSLYQDRISVEQMGERKIRLTVCLSASAFDWDAMRRDEMQHSSTQAKDGHDKGQ